MGRGTVKNAREMKAKRKTTLLQSWLCIPFAAKKEPSREEFGVLVCSQCYSFWAVIGAEPVPATDELSWELSVRKGWCGEHSWQYLNQLGIGHAFRRWYSVQFLCPCPARCLPPTVSIAPCRQLLGAYAS